MGRKANECIKCGKIYKGDFSMKIHVKIVHEGIRFECLLCGKLFSPNISLSGLKVIDVPFFFFILSFFVSGVVGNPRENS